MANKEPTMNKEYVCYYGTHQGKLAESLRELFNLPHCEGPDDGTIVYTIAREQNCSWNQGRCPCGGLMRWAEAGHGADYGPWHRICDHCGSHWTLHPIITRIKNCGKPGEPPRWELEPDTDAIGDHAAAVLIRLQNSVIRFPLTVGEIDSGSICGSWAERAKIRRHKNRDV
jgi:hypothetical protein